jgi:hypothetical protein
LFLKPGPEPSEILASGIQRLHNEKSTDRYPVKEITCRETEKTETTGQSAGRPDVQEPKIGNCTIDKSHIKKIMR